MVVNSTTISNDSNVAIMMNKKIYIKTSLKVAKGSVDVSLGIFSRKFTSTAVWVSLHCKLIEM